MTEAEISFVHCHPSFVFLLPIIGVCAVFSQIVLIQQFLLHGLEFSAQASWRGSS